GGGRCLFAYIPHREVTEVVRHQDCPVGSRRAGDERVRRLNRNAASPVPRLVAACPRRSLASRWEKTKPGKQRVGCLSLLGPQTTLHLRDVDAARSQRMTTGQQAEQQVGGCLVAAHVPGQDACVEQLETQAPLAAPRP